MEDLVDECAGVVLLFFRFSPFRVVSGCSIVDGHRHQNDKEGERDDHHKQVEKPGDKNNQLEEPRGRLSAFEASFRLRQVVTFAAVPVTWEAATRRMFRVVLVGSTDEVTLATPGFRSVVHDLLATADSDEPRNYYHDNILVGVANQADVEH